MSSVNLLAMSPPLAGPAKSSLTRYEISTLVFLLELADVSVDAAVVVEQIAVLIQRAALPATEQLADAEADLRSIGQADQAADDLGSIPTLPLVQGTRHGVSQAAAIRSCVRTDDRHLRGRHCPGRSCTRGISRLTRRW